MTGPHLSAADSAGAGRRPDCPAGPRDAKPVDLSFRPAVLLMAGRAVGFAATFFIPVVLARAFTQAEFGTYKQLFLLYATLYGIGQLGMAESLFYFLPLGPRDGGRYVMNSLLALAAAGVACLALLWSAGPSISRWLSNSELAEQIPLIGIYLLLMLSSAGLEIVMIARRRYGWAACSYGLSDLLRAALYILPVLLLGGLKWLLLGAVAFAGLRVAASLAYLRREFTGDLRPDRALLRRQLDYALPFELAVLAETLQLNFHQYAVSYYFNAATFAIYSVGCLQIPLVDFLATSAANVMMVRMAEQIREGRRDAVVAMWHDTTRRLALIFLPLVGILLVSAREIILVLFTERYLASVPIFRIWSIAIVLSGLTTDAVLRVYAETRFLLLLNVVRLLLVAALITWFLATFQLPGAALVTLGAALVAKAWALARVKGLLRVRLGRLLPWRSLAGIAATAAAAGLPALAIRSALAVPTWALLAMTSLVYAGSFLALALVLGLLPGEERPAVAAWVRHWRGRMAQGVGLRRGAHGGPAREVGHMPRHRFRRIAAGDNGQGSRDGSPTSGAAGAPGDEGEERCAASQES